MFLLTSDIGLYCEHHADRDWRGDVSNRCKPFSHIGLCPACNPGMFAHQGENSAEIADGITVESYEEIVAPFKARIRQLEAQLERKDGRE